MTTYEIDFSELIEETSSVVDSATSAVTLEGRPMHPMDLTEITDPTTHPTPNPTDPTTHPTDPTHPTTNPTDPLILRSDQDDIEHLEHIEHLEQNPSPVVCEVEEQLPSSAPSCSDPSHKATLVELTPLVTYEDDISSESPVVADSSVCNMVIQNNHLSHEIIDHWKRPENSNDFFILSKACELFLTKDYLRSKEEQEQSRKLELLRQDKHNQERQFTLDREHMEKDKNEEINQLKRKVGELEKKLNYSQQASGEKELKLREALHQREVMVKGLVEELDASYEEEKRQRDAEHQAKKKRILASIESS